MVPTLLLLCAAAAAGAGDHGSLIQTNKGADDSSWVNALLRTDSDTGSSYALRLLRAIPGLSGRDFPNLPNIDMGEMMSLMPLVPQFFENVRTEFPKAETKAHNFARVANNGAKELLATAREHPALPEVQAAIRKYVVDFKGAWVDFAMSMEAGMGATFVPTIQAAHDRVSFIPEHAADSLVNTIVTMLNETGMSVMAQLPVGRNGELGLIRVNQIVERSWNRTIHHIPMINRALEVNGLLDSIQGLPLGPVTKNIIEELRRPSRECLNAVSTANANMRDAIHGATAFVGVDWEHHAPVPAAVEEEKTADEIKEESSGARCGLGLLAALGAALAWGLL